MPAGAVIGWRGCRTFEVPRPPAKRLRPPPAMPDWSPVRRFGGYAAWGDGERSTAKAETRRVASACRRVRVGDARDFTSLWGALGCACWAV